MSLSSWKSESITSPLAKFTDMLDAEKISLKIFYFDNPARHLHGGENAWSQEKFEGKRWRQGWEDWEGGGQGEGGEEEGEDGGQHCRWTDRKLSRKNKEASISKRNRKVNKQAP